MYAVTTKQNINIAMFGWVKKQTCISKTLHAQFNSMPPRLYRYYIKLVLCKSIQIMGREIVLLFTTNYFLIDLKHFRFSSLKQTWFFSFWSLPCSTYEHYALRWDTGYLAQDVFEGEMKVHSGKDCRSGFCLLIVGDTGGYKVNRTITMANISYLRIHNTGSKQYALSYKQLLFIK